MTSAFPALLVIVSFFYTEERVDTRVLENDDRRNNTM